ncbi:MAG: hypothetical protein V3U19_00965 [Thermodesulfobacteriota bacterium]
MSEGEQKKGTNKVVLILAGLILVAVVVMFALKYGGGPAEELAGTYVAEGQEGITWVEKEITVPEVEKPEAEIQETKKPVLPKALRQLTPEETVEAFAVAVKEERYDDALKYVSSQSQFKTKWDISKKASMLLAGSGNNDFTITIRGVKYLDKTQTMAEVEYRTFRGSRAATATSAKLQKENGVWKIMEL